MPGSNLGSAYVQIIPSAEGISGSITGVLNGEATAAGEKAGGLFSGGFAKKAKKGLKVATVGLLAFGAAGTAVMAKGIKETAEYGDHVDKMSQKIGFSAEEYQKWDYVLQRAGADVDSMQSSMKTLSVAAVNNSEAFQKLGLSQEEVANMSQGELFEATIRQLSSMENQTERTALASQLLGRNATELAPLLNGGTEAFEEQMEMAERYGMVMSDEAVKASAEFQDSLTTLSMTFTGFKNRVMGDFLPSVTTITSGFAKILAGDLSGFDEVVAGFNQLISKIKEKLPSLLELGGKIISSIVTGITEAIPKLAEKGVELIQNLGNGTDSKMGEFIHKAFELIKNFALEIGKAAAKLIPAAIGKVIQLIIKTDWIGLGKKVVKALWDGIKAITPLVWQFIKDFVRQIMDALGFSGLRDKVSNVFNSAKEAILAPVNALKDRISEIIDRIKGFFNFSVPTPHIPKPHFSIYPPGWKLGDLLKGSIPSLDISWYAKGAIMKKPVLFGGGEAGPEGIVPLDPLWDKLDAIAAGTGDNITINVYAAAGQSVNDIAAAVERRLIQSQKQRNLAWT